VKCLGRRELIRLCLFASLGEYFSLQVDSHVRFVADWDEDIIDQWKSTGNEMAVLSTYLSDIANSIDPITHQSLRESRSIMCNAEFEWKGDSKEHIKYSIQPTNKPRIQSSPMLHPFWAAGFSFARGHLVLTVPYDPILPLVFQGEEISMTIRAFTHGYDFYAPQRNVAYHIYATRENKESRLNVKTFTENAALFPGAKEEAYHRLNGIIGTGKPSIEFIHLDQKLYGLGGARRPETFYRTFGIDVNGSEMEQGLCDFVQGVGGHTSMHQDFSPFLRYNGMGIDYSRIKFEYKAKNLVDSPIAPEELADLRENLRRRQRDQI
jgi:[Skp1-protein]-hydroxyproline N-acetylglucosaminyltransferase